MRRGTMLVLGLLVASTAMPQSAQARSDLFGTMFDALTAPVGAILGAGRHPGRRAAYHRRANVSSPSNAIPPSQPGSAKWPSPSRAAAGVVAAAGPTEARCHKLPTTTGSAPSNDPGPRETTQSIAQDTTAEPGADTLAPVSARSGRWPGRAPTRMSSASRCGRSNTASGCGVHGIGDVLGTAFAPGASIAARARQARADEPGQARPLKGHRRSSAAAST